MVGFSSIMIILNCYPHNSEVNPKSPESITRLEHLKKISWLIKPLLCHALCVTSLSLTLLALFVILKKSRSQIRVDLIFIEQ